MKARVSRSTEWPLMCGGLIGLIASGLAILDMGLGTTFFVMGTVLGLVSAY